MNKYFLKFLKSFSFVRKIEQERDDAISFIAKAKSVKARMNAEKEHEYFFAQKGKDLRKVSVIPFSDDHKKWLKDCADAEEGEKESRKNYRQLTQDLLDILE